MSRTPFAGPSLRRAFAVASTIAIVGCSSDDVSSPSSRSILLPKANAAIGDVTEVAVVYDQYANGGTSSLVNRGMADDFVVPDGETWTIGQVLLTGRVQGSELVKFRFYQDGDGQPGEMIPGTDVNLRATASAPHGRFDYSDYIFSLPTPVTLTSGRYWLFAGEANSDTWLVILHRSFDDAGSAKTLNVDGSWGPNFDFGFVLLAPRKTQTVAFTSSAPASALVGGSYTPTAQASSGRPVAITAAPGAACTIASGVVSLVGAGTCTVTASQKGDGTYAPASPVTQSFLVEKAAQVIAFTSTPPSPALLNGTYDVTATGGGSGNPVQFSVAPASVCSISGATVTFVGVGACTITATQLGNVAFTDAAPKTQVVTSQYAFGGFGSPVRTDAPNVANSGQTIPLKWRLVDATGVPVTNLGAVTVTVVDIACALGTSSDLTTESATGTSGLQNKGDGNYQFNWKTPKSYASSCKRLRLDLGDGVLHTVDFDFTR